MTNSVYDNLDNIDDICQENIKNMTDSQFYDIQLNNHKIREYIEGLHKNSSTLDIKYKTLLKLHKSEEYSIQQNKALDRASKIIEEQSNKISGLTDSINLLLEIIAEQREILEEYKKEIMFSSKLKYGEHKCKKDDADIVNRVIQYYAVDKSINKVAKRADTPSYNVCAEIIHENLGGK